MMREKPTVYPFVKSFLIAFLTLLFLNSQSQSKSINIMEDQLQIEQDKVIKTVRLLADLMINKDIDGMSKILAENYTLTHMTGYVQPKSEWFSEVAKESMKYYSAKEVGHKIIIDHNKAEVTVQNLVDAKIWGSRNMWRLQQKISLEKRSGQWIILKSIASTF